MKESFALRVRGWTVTTRPSAVVESLLGGEAFSGLLERPPTEWAVLHAIPCGFPVGIVDAIIAIKALDVAINVDMVPGSIGVAVPPPANTDAVVRVSLAKGETLLVDDRLWLRLLPTESASFVIWRNLDWRWRNGST